MVTIPTKRSGPDAGPPPDPDMVERSLTAIKECPDGRDKLLLVAAQARATLQRVRCFQCRWYDEAEHRPVGEGQCCIRSPRTNTLALEWCGEVIE